MPYFRKLIPGEPYTRSFAFTQGFEDGVGYLKNFAKHNPVYLMTMGIVAVATVGVGIKTYNYYKSDPDVVYKYKNRYTVVRKEDVPNPDKDCYN